MGTPTRSSENVLKTLHLVRRLELKALPIGLKSKLTDEEEFTDRGYVPPWERWIKEDLGIGVVLGGDSLLIDIDIDDPRITGLAAKLLPPTSWRYGRKSKKSSHFVYIASNVANMTQNSSYEEILPLKSEGYRNLFNKEAEPGKRGGDTVIEFRADKNQSVLPGTLHEGTGELIEWHAAPPETLPPVIDPFELRGIVKRIAMTVIVSDHAWEPGLRHEVTMNLAGMMVANKWKEPEALSFFTEVMNFTGQGERGNILRAVKDTFKRFHDGMAIGGGPKLAEILGGDRLVLVFRKWFSDALAAAFEDYDARYMALMHFGKFFIGLRHSIDDVAYTDFDIMNLGDFTSRCCNDLVWVDTPGAKEKGKKTPVAKSKLWLMNPKRTTFDRTIFKPGSPKEDGDTFNTWRGWAADPSPHGSCQHWLDHVRQYICEGDEGLFKWMMDWMADLVQDPMEKPGTAIVMCSDEGTGKNTFVDMLSQMIGLRYYREMTQPDQVTSRFNSHLEHAMLIFCNEATFAKDPRHLPILNALVTDKTFQLEMKHAQARTARNYIRVIMASNKSHVIERTATDRRFTVTDVRSPAADYSGEDLQAYFNGIRAEIHGDGPSALMQMLLNWKYDKWDIRTPYITAAAKRQSMMSLSPGMQFWLNCLNAGEIMMEEEHITGVPVSGSTDAYPDGWPSWVAKPAYEAAFLSSKYAARMSSTEMWVDFYKNSGVENVSRKKTISGKRKNVALLPTLDECVERFHLRYPGALAVSKEEDTVEAVSDEMG